MTSDSSNFLNRLRVGCQRCQMFETRVLIGVSGGADSIALLRGLLHLCDELKLDLSVAHLNHQLRGAEADSDMEWVRETCFALSVPCVVESCHIATRPEVKDHGIEGAARIVRRQFLRSVALRQSCPRIALAHNRNDQAETILHNIIRGTSLFGLRGMQCVTNDETLDLEDVAEWGDLPGIPTKTVQNTTWVRPMLHIERLAIEEFLAQLNQPFCIDSTNHDLGYTRNRIRHQLLSYLQQNFNPRIVDTLVQLGELAKDSLSFEDEVIEREWELGVTSADRNGCCLDCEVLWSWPVHRIRGLLISVWKRLGWPRKNMSFRHWEKLAQLVNSPHGAVSLPGRLQATRQANSLIIQRTIAPTLPNVSLHEQPAHPHKPADSL